MLQGSIVTCLTTEVKIFPWKQITREEGVDSRHSADNTLQPQRRFAKPSGKVLAQWLGLSLALAFLGSTAQLPGTALSLSGPQHRALPLCQAPSSQHCPGTELPLQAQGPKSQLLACRAWRCSQSSGVLQQHFSMQETQGSCPAPPELQPCAPRG